MDADLLHLRSSLRPIEVRARDLPWAAKRPWGASTHVGAADGLPLIDLHDLSVRLALDTTRQVLEADLQSGGAVLITGRGSHTAGRSPLRDAVLAELDARRTAGGLTHRPLGPGRIEVVWDPDRARASRPGLGVLFWLVVLLVLAGLLAALVQ